MDMQALNTDKKSQENVKQLIKELKRLSRPRSYILKIMKDCGILIDVAWCSDVKISVENVDQCHIDGRTKTLGFIELQKELTKFQKEVDQMLDQSDKIAKKFHISKTEFFEEILFESEQP